MGVPKINDTVSTDWGSQSKDYGNRDLIRQGEHTWAQVAERLHVSVEELFAANPQLARTIKPSAGIEIRIPAARVPAENNGVTADDAAPDDPPPSSSRQSDARLDATLMRARITASAGRTTVASTGAGTADVQVDPRFDAVNQALQAGRGEEAAAAAKKLIATLQAEKPPQQRLLDQARMSLAAASMLQGDLEGASKTLLTINPKKLDADDKDHFEALRDLVKDSRRASFSEAFNAAVDGGADGKAKAKAAASEAAKLVDFLQKTEPGNTGEIVEAKLKQANALLAGNSYRDAEKVLNGVNEKLLDSGQKEYLDGLRHELHSQQVDALATGYEGDMRRKKYKDAVSDSTALVNNLVKYFPDDKDRIVSARLKQGAAQIMNGDMEDARKTLGRISAKDLDAMPDGARKQFKQLDGAVKEHFETVQKMKALEAEKAVLQRQLKSITDLTTSGDPAKAKQAIPMAEQLLADVRQKLPDDKAAIDAARLTVAGAKLAAGNIDAAKADLTAVAADAKDPAIKDEVQFLQARVALREGHTDNAVSILQSLADKGSTPDFRKAAKAVIISVEADHLAQVDKKAMLEAKGLVDLDNNNRSGNVVLQFFKMPSKPLSAMDNYKRDYNRLTNTATGAAMAASIMTNDGITLAELQKMPHDALVKRIGEQTAAEIEMAFRNPDVQTIAKHDFDGGHLTWQKNSLYVDPSYFDSSLDKISQWIGKQVRGARSYDEELKASDSAVKRAIGYGSAFILDRVSDANQFVKDKIKNASDFYNDPVRKDTWYAKLGRAGTFGGDVLSSVFTMPATIVDYKATDDERKGAIVGTVLMAATAGIIKGGGPAWKSISNATSKGAARIAATDVGQWIAKSTLGRVVSTTARGAGWVGKQAGKLEEKFEATGFAKTMDKVKTTLGKLNPTIGGGKTTFKSLDEAVDEILAEKTPGQLKAGVTADEIAAKRAEFRQYGQNPDIYTDDQIRRMVLGDKIYKGNYNAVGEPKPATMSQPDFEARLQRYDGPKADDRFWHRRYNKPGPNEVPANVEQPAWWSDGDVRRVYFNVKPDNAAELADFLADGLNGKGIKFQYKMPKQIGRFDRADSGVLYVEKGNYEATKKLVMEFAKKHPDAFANGSPAFTKQIGKGISVAEEPVQANLPVTPGGLHSFGSSRSDIIAEAILSAPANASKAEIKRLVRERLEHYGFNPDKPWLKQNNKVDDL